MDNCVLIVEDDKDINQMLADLLAAHQYKVIQAYSGTEGKCGGVFGGRHLYD